MSIIKKIPWKALGILTIGLVIGLYFGAKGAVSVIVQFFDSDGVKELVNKPTNENNTTIDFKDNKFKKSDSINIILTQKPTTKQEIIKKADSCLLSKSEFNKFSKADKRRFNRIKNK